MGSRPRGGEAFPPIKRVRRSATYRLVQAEAERVHTRHFVLLVRAREGAASGWSGPRLGLVVSKKVGSAVRRNRVKRLLREVFRRHEAWFPHGCDVVIVAKRGSTSLDYAQVAEEVGLVRSLLARRAVRSRRRLAAERDGVKVPR